MLQAATIGVLLTLAPQAAPAGKTLWVVQPLYPGQEMLVTRTEEALRRLMANSTDQLIGRAALAEHLKGKKADLGCLTGDVACTDPVDAFVASLGLERVVMLKGGQEDAAYRYKATSYLPATGETTASEGAGPSLERALLASLLKVAPLASTVEIASEPAGATVFIDGEKVGVTPYTGQLLPGERTVKLELASHMPAEKKLEVPVRGRLTLKHSLEKVPARIVLTALPAGTSIAIDGVQAGVDKIDKPIQPGRHQLSFACEGYEPLTETVNVEPGATFTAERSLLATRWTRFKGALRDAQENIYKRGPSLTVSYEWAQMWGDRLHAKQDITKGEDEADSVFARQLLGRSDLHGISAEYSHDGRYFGVMIAGVGYYTSSPWRYTLEHAKTTEMTGKPTLVLLRGLQPHVRVALWRFVLSLQAGFEMRALVLQPVPSVPESDRVTVWFLDAQLTGQATLRAFLVEGLFVEGMYRFSWTFSKHAAIRGVHAGIGYAF